MAGHTYTAAFLDGIRQGSRSSAQVVVPLIMGAVPVQSVVDVGCGLGAWLKVFSEHGVDDIQGIDGDYVDRQELEIPESRFLAHDLTRPLRLPKRYDLVVSLEVGEHLPQESADDFVDTLTSLGSVVMFSAAIPTQGGNFHVNEQWPTYWAEKFRHRGYVVVDYIRPKIWHDPRVQWWYAQNKLVFVDETVLGRYPELEEQSRYAEYAPLSLVHPEPFLFRADRRWWMLLYRSFAVRVPPQVKSTIRTILPLPKPSTQSYWNA
jgi:SAM-dependent methyltransferase